MAERNLSYNADQSRFSPDNRLNADQFTAMAVRLKDRYGVSDARALNMVIETQMERQRLIDEQVKAKGGMAWSEFRDTNGGSRQVIDSTLDMTYMDNRALWK